jgi:hypothetical protein
MNLTETDANLIRRLKQKEQIWRRSRWVVLLFSILVFGSSIFTFERIWSTAAPDQILITLCVLVAPLCGIILASAVAGIIYTAVLWRGCPAKKLLLKLAYEVEAPGIGR